ncbi:HNH endonuclease [Solibacillus sp.]|uniref:HNH endonuclease n=1 Tax=Solibacillus sp. TaxID=1909654 RepID=UPI003315A595
MYIFAYKDLQSADFISDSIYESEGKKIFNKLFKIGDFKSLGAQGGIRRASVEVPGIKGENAFMIIIDTQKQDDYPNNYDSITKTLTYYGDNRKVGNDIFNTQLKGNETFKKLFDLAYGSEKDRKNLFPTFFFQQISNSSNMKFIGLAVPFVEGKNKNQVLQRKTFTTPEGSYENYIAQFTIIPKLSIKREWLYDLKSNRKDYSPSAPKEWLDFINNGSIEINTPNDFSENNTYGLIDPIYTQHTKEMIVQTRITQHKFRQGLLQTQEKCQICGIDVPELLVASHIKPWIISDDNEKIDLNNGLLLCANHDKLFDRKLITFNQNGSLLISPKINRKELLELLNLTPASHLVINEEQEKYLAHHRNNF